MMYCVVTMTLIHFCFLSNVGGLTYIFFLLFSLYKSVWAAVPRQLKGGGEEKKGESGRLLYSLLFVFLKNYRSTNMRALEDWLASSSSSSSSLNEGSPQSALLAMTTGGRSTFSEGIRTRQEEMRDRMRSLLGENVVNAVVAESGVAEDAVVSRPFLPTKTNSGKELQQSDGGGDDSASKSRLLHSSSQSPPPNAYRPVEVMVVDRGTQTTTTVGCQTDPDLYQPYPGYLAPLHGVCNCGGIRRPYASALGDEGTPAHFREQLDMIQSSIDAMIARYNLPPPPPPFPRA